LLVERGIAATVDEARRLIMAGDVSTEGRRVDKAGELLDSHAVLNAKAGARYVSRGGLKLEHGLDAFEVDPTGRVCLDAGCSTGGFTDCLLQRGARLVHAVDVGYGQLDWSLRNDERVVVHERTNVRALSKDSLQPAPDLVVADLAFVSLAAVFASLVEAASEATDYVVLVKPQFELPRDRVADGVVRDPALHDDAVRRVRVAGERLGLAFVGSVRSPLLGPEGNVEFLAAFEAARRSRP
jgi:23S rRNA (cytidine1920-2'-O)/16S rRNA (cytidine1409-2'-O)-methyltransferase